MKYLLLILVLAVIFIALGYRRSRPRQPEARPPQPSAQPEAMLRCAECGMHLPADESLPGKGGVFCSDAHRASHEARLGPL